MRLRDLTNPLYEPIATRAMMATITSRMMITVIVAPMRSPRNRHRAKFQPSALYLLARARYAPHGRVFLPRLADCISSLGRPDPAGAPLPDARHRVFCWLAPATRLKTGSSSLDSLAPPARSLVQTQPALRYPTLASPCTWPLSRQAQVGGADGEPVRQTGLLDPLTGTGTSVDDHRDTDDVRSCLVQCLHCSQYRIARRTGVLYRHHSTSQHIRAFNAALQAMRFLRLPHEKGVQPIPGRGRGVQHRSGHRIGAAGEPAGRIEVPIGHQISHHAPDDGCCSAVHRHSSQVDVVIALDARGQRDPPGDNRQFPDLLDQERCVIRDGQLSHAVNPSPGAVTDAAIRVLSMASPWKAARVRSATATIFAEMSALAVATNSVNLGQGFPDTDGPEFMLDEAMAAIASGINQYPPGKGIAPLRKAIADHCERRYGLNYDPDTEVLVTTGATEALAAAILAFVDPGDEVIALEPFYDSYAASIELAGGVRVGVGLFGPDFRLDLDEFAAAFTPRTKAILINSPHNPTGVVLSLDEVAEIARLAVENDVLVICDEVYEHLIFDGAEHWPLAAFPDMRERTVRISSAGKTFSATGWKIGWALSTPELIAEITAV